MRRDPGAHETVCETREERQAAGRPVDNLAGGGAGYEALGGLTNFSSLVDGIDRLALGAPDRRGMIEGEAPLDDDALDAYGGGAGAPPPRKQKLTAEDEFALYDAKYKKPGGGGVSRPRPAAAAAASLSSAARGGRAAAPPAAAAENDDYGQDAQPRGGGGSGGGGAGRAYDLFSTSVGDARNRAVRTAKSQHLSRLSTWHSTVYASTQTSLARQCTRLGRRSPRWQLVARSYRRRLERSGQQRCSRAPAARGLGHSGPRRELQHAAVVAPIVPTAARSPLQSAACAGFARVTPQQTNEANPFCSFSKIEGLAV